MLWNRLKQCWIAVRIARSPEDRSIPNTLNSPLKYGFRTIVYVVEDHKSTVHGLALLNYDEKLNFCYLDYLLSAKTAPDGA